MSQDITDAAVKEIDGHRFEVCKLDPTVSLHMLRNLMAAVGPSFGAMLNGASLESLSNSQVDIGRAVRELFDRLDNKMLDDMVKTWDAVSFVDGKRVRDVYSAIFRGKISMQLEWLSFCITSEYEELVGKAKNAIARSLGAVATRLGSKFQDILKDGGIS